MFVVEYLKTDFNEDGGIIEQERNTKYFDDLKNAIKCYDNTRDYICGLDTVPWDVYVISLFGGSELLKMETIR